MLLFPKYNNNKNCMKKSFPGFNNLIFIFLYIFIFTLLPLYDSAIICTVARCLCPLVWSRLQPGGTLPVRQKWTTMTFHICSQTWGTFQIKFYGKQNPLALLPWILPTQSSPWIKIPTLNPSNHEALRVGEEIFCQTKFSYNFKHIMLAIDSLHDQSLYRGFHLLTSSFHIEQFSEIAECSKCQSAFPLANRRSGVWVHVFAETF